MRRIVVSLLLALVLVAPAMGAAPVAPISPIAPYHSADIDRKLLDREAIRKTIDKQTTVGGRAVAIDSSVSELTVRAIAGDQMKLTAKMEFWSNDEDYMKIVEESFRVELLETAERIEIGVELPKQPKRGLLKRMRNLTVHYSVDLTLDVPRGTELDIRNKYGSVDVKGVGGQARISNTSGTIDFEDGRGPVILEARYGDVVVAEIDGPLTATTVSGSIEARAIRGSARLSSQYGNLSAVDVEGEMIAEVTSGAVHAKNLQASARISSSYGDVVIESVGGALSVSTTSGNVTIDQVSAGAEVTSSYGYVHADEIRGDFSVETKSGETRISNVHGSLRVQGSYGNVHAEHVTDDAEIATSSGAVTLLDVGGDAGIRCSYGTVRARQIGGRLTIKASSTQVEAEEIGGAVQVETSYGGVGLRGVGGAVTVLNQSGAVTVRGLTGDALEAEHRVETSYADIRFDWPEAQPLNFRLESTYGQVVSRLPGTLSESGSRKIFEGHTGTAGGRLTLVAKSGSVRLTKE